MCCRCTKTRAKITWALLECLFFSGLLSGWYLVISQMKSQDFFGSNCTNVTMPEEEPSKTALGFEKPPEKPNTNLPYTIEKADHKRSKHRFEFENSYALCAPTFYQAKASTNNSYNSTGENESFSSTGLVNLVSFPVCFRNFLSLKTTVVLFN